MSQHISEWIMSQCISRWGSSERMSIIDVSHFHAFMKQSTRPTLLISKEKGFNFIQKSGITLPQNPNYIWAVLSIPSCDVGCHKDFHRAHQVFQSSKTHRPEKRTGRRASSPYLIYSPHSPTAPRTCSAAFSDSLGRKQRTRAVHKTCELDDEVILRVAAQIPRAQVFTKDRELKTNIARIRQGAALMTDATLELLAKHTNVTLLVPDTSGWEVWKTLQIGKATSSPRLRKRARSNR
mgnify:CR=1 FL=1